MGFFRHPRIKTGDRFGRLKVIKRLKIKNRRQYWECLCECGVSKKILDHSLKTATKSCGCLAREIAAKLCISRTKHGMATKKKSPEYQCWLSMRARCSIPSATGYSHYGKRGISVCKRWDSFESFYEDMGPRPSKAHSLDRINNNKNYEPQNCRWAVKEVQANNTRSNRKFLYKNEMLTLPQIARLEGVKFDALRWKVFRAENKISIEGAVQWLKK